MVRERLYCDLMVVMLDPVHVVSFALLDKKTEGGNKEWTIPKHRQHSVQDTHRVKNIKINNTSHKLKRFTTETLP
jgi:hypothetical protein